MSYIPKEILAEEAEDWLVDIKEYNPKKYKALMKDGKEKAIEKLIPVMDEAHDKEVEICSAIMSDGRMSEDYYKNLQVVNEAKIAAREMVYQDLKKRLLGL